MVKVTRHRRVLLLALSGCFGAIAPQLLAAQGLPTETPPPPPLVWQTCPDSPTRDCATLTVPLDYADLSKGYIDLPVARAPATGQRIGTLIVHLGAQGSPLVPIIKSPSFEPTEFSSELQQRFDIVGVDHRGTTQGITCLPTSTQLEQYWEANHLARTISEINQLLGRESAFNAACAENGQPMIHHVDGASAVRDMEQLRRAMGMETFSFFGRSYGTFIGHRYAQLYPGHLRALALDSIVDRSVSDLQALQESNLVLQVSWNRFKTWCQTPANACSMQGENIDAVLDQLLAQARANPIPAPTSPYTQRPVNDWIMLVAIKYAFVQAGELGHSLIDQMIDQARQGDAWLPRAIYDEQTGIPGQYGVNSASRAIRCEDASWSQLLSGAAYVKALAATSKAIAPRFGESSVFEVATQCFQFPVAPVEPPPIPGAVTGLQHALLVSGTRDPITPLTGAVRVSQQISASRLLLREGDRHLSYDRSACVRQKVDRYLVDLTLPAVGTVCSTDPL
jgi:pimeloyl-ACP methyl ester carboxylesterase